MLCDDEWDKLKKHFLEQSQIDAIKAAKSSMPKNKAKEYEKGLNNGEIANRENAKEKMKQSQGKIITSKDGIKVTIGINAINNIVSGKKILKSTKGRKFNPRQYLAAAADIENLFRNATRVLRHPDYKNDINTKEIHNFVTPLFGDNIAYITIKEATIEGKRIYNMELLELGELEGKIREVISKTTHQTAASSP